MKAKYHGQINHPYIMRPAFSTIEIVFALAILMISLTGIVSISAGNESMLVESATSADAQDFGEGLLQREMSLGKKDFDLVNGTTSTETLNGVRFNGAVTITQSSDLLSKIITAIVSWTGVSNEGESLELSTLVTNLTEDNETCNSLPSGDWSAPHVVNPTTNFGSLVHDTSGVYPITSIDAYKGFIYTTTNNTSANTTNTFFVFSNSTTLLGSIDNATVAAGLNAVVVATSSLGNYAYVADGYGASFATCKPGAGNCAQLQVIDVTNPASLHIVSNFEVPTSSGPFIIGSGGQAVGNAIAYARGYVYLGLSKTSSGPEFDIIDVHNPLSPVWIAGYPIGHDIDSILIRNNYAYIAHPSDTTQKEQLTILDVSHPNAPTYVTSYYSGDANSNGKAVTAVGSTLYLGTTVSTAKAELFSFDQSSLPILTLVKSKEVSSSVVALAVRDSLAFLLTSKQGVSAGSFVIINATSSAPIATLPLPGIGASGTTFDCEGNSFFVGSSDSSGKSYLSVITSS